MKKIKKIFYIILCCFILSSCSNLIDYSEICLYEALPKIPNARGSIIKNTDEYLCLQIKSNERKADEYVKTCMISGYSIESKFPPETQYYYKAFNSDGYEIRIEYYNDFHELDIILVAPIEMNLVTWPNNHLTREVPIPKSLYGKIESVENNRFYAYIGNMTVHDYNEYVKKVLDSGFTNNLTKNEDYFHGVNDNNYSIEIRYIGFNRITILIRKVG